MIKIINNLDSTTGVQLDFNFLNADLNQLHNLAKAIPEHNFVLIKNVKPNKTRLNSQIHKIGKSYIRPEGLYFYDDDHAEIVRVTNKRIDGEKIGLFADDDLCWHADGCLRNNIKQTTLILYCDKPGDKGYGITGFCNTKQAYEDLNLETKKLVENIEVRHSADAFANKIPTVGKNDGGYNIQKDDKEYEIFNGSNAKDNGSTVYTTEKEAVFKPLVHFHPWHGEKSINFTPSIITEWQYKDGSKIDLSVSNDLWNYLYNHIFQEKYVYQHQWEQGDLIFNDQWYTMHNRTAVKGDRSLWRWHIDNYWLFH